MSYPQTGDLVVALQDSVATVTLNRPRVRNAVTLAMWNGLAELFHRFAADDAVRAVILTGAGEHFCAGADISEFATVRNSAESGHAYDRAVDICSDAILHIEKPTIAAIRGFCIGGGSGLALACDFRFAAPSAIFAITAAKLSIVYGMRETQNLLALVGLSNAKKILFSAERFDTAEASRIGPQLHTALSFVSQEHGLLQPGYEAVASRLMDLLFIQILRAAMLQRISLIGDLAALFFISDQYSKQLWLLMGLGPVVLSMARAAKERHDSAQLAEPRGI